MHPMLPVALSATHRNLFLFGILTLSFVLLPKPGAAQVSEVPPDSPRRTPVVEVISRVDAAVAALFQPHESGHIHGGSGVIIHPDGFVLTNSHVVPQKEGLALLGSGLPVGKKRIPFVVAGRLSDQDLAVVKLLAHGPFPTVPLGRSHDLMNGEPIITAGNPGGRGTVFTSGIISARKVLSGGPNALVMTRYQDSFRPQFIQYDAASNRGNSGGPLINMEGRLIGIVSAMMQNEQNVGLAIPVDDIFRRLDRLVEPEVLTRRQLGLTLTEDFTTVKVDAVTDGLPAAAAGIQPGDIIQAVNGRLMNHHADWVLTQRVLLDTGRPQQLTLRQNDQERTVSVRPAPLAPQPAVTISENSLAPGLQYELFDYDGSQLPDFDSLTVKTEGVTTEVTLPDIRPAEREHFALRITGYIRVPQDETYTLRIRSDDGSQLFLHDQLVIDNGGHHPPQGVSRLFYLQQGLHPIRIEFFQGDGAAELGLTVQSGKENQLLSNSDILFHQSTETSAAESDQEIPE